LKSFKSTDEFLVIQTISLKIGQADRDRVRRDGRLWRGREVWVGAGGGGCGLGESGGTCSMEGGTVVLGGISSMAGSGRKRRRIGK
jgi:hypothetical protein